MGCRKKQWDYSVYVKVGTIHPHFPLPLFPFTPVTLPTAGALPCSPAKASSELCCSGLSTPIRACLAHSPFCHGCCWEFCSRGWKGRCSFSPLCTCIPASQGLYTETVEPRKSGNSASVPWWLTSSSHFVWGENWSCRGTGQWSMAF